MRPAGQTTAGLLAPVAARMARAAALFVSSFDPSALLILRERAPEVALGLLTWVGFPLRKAIPAAAHLGVEWWVPTGLRSGRTSSTGRRSTCRPRSRSPSRTRPAWRSWPGPRRSTRALELLEAGVDAVVVDDVPSTLPLLAHLAD